MTLDPACAAVIAAFAEVPMPAVADLDAPTYRALVNGGIPVSPAPIAYVANVTLGDISARLYHHDPSRPLPVLVYFHGGGWVAGTLDTHDPLCRALAIAGKCAVISVDYRLAPEYPFPAALDDCIAAVQWIATNGAELGVDGRRLALGGDSAGANLAAATAQYCASANGPVVRRQLLFYPVVEPNFQSISYQDNGDGYFLTRDLMEWFWKCYAGDSAMDDPRMSLLKAEDLSNLPPTMIVTAEYDPLRSEGDAYAVALADAGVTVEHVRKPGMIHGFVSMIGIVAQAQSTINAGGALVAAGFKEP